MRADSGIIYAEVYDMLKFMDKSTVMKIPVEILEYIKENRDVNFESDVDPDDIFNKNNIQPESLNLMAWLDLNYWADDKAKKELRKIYYEKEILLNPNTFSFKNDNLNNSRDGEQRLLIETPEKKSFFDIFKKIKDLFNNK